MGNVQDSGDAPPERPPKPTQNLPTAYPNLKSDQSDDDHHYEILSMPAPGGFIPSRPAPVVPPVTRQQSVTNTLSNSHFRALEGVPFVINTQIISSKSTEKAQFPMIKARTVAQVLKDYDYDFRLERRSVLKQ